MWRFAAGLILGWMAHRRWSEQRASGGRRSGNELIVRRDPEDRPVHSRAELREKMLDKTIADSYPASDPPSTLPDPGCADSEQVA